MIRYLYILVLTVFIKTGFGQCTSTPSYSLDCATGYISYSITVSGGNPPYTFTYTPNVPNTTFGNVSVATYSAGPISMAVNFSDANSCSGNTFYSINAFMFNSLMNISTLSPFTQNVSCHGGNDGALSLTVTGSAAPPPYSYTVNGSAIAGSTITNLSAGVYTVTAKTGSGCIRTVTLAITEPADLSSSTTNTINCYGASISAPITTTGGISPYTYSVNGSAIPGNTIPNLVAGTHTLLTKDANGCTKTNIITVNQPAAPVFNFNAIQPTCPTSSNGALSVTVLNMGSINAYTWAPSSTPFNMNLNNIPQAIYTVTVKSLLNCISSATFQLLPISNIQKTVTTTPETCSAADGAATVNVTGGVLPLTYSLNALPIQGSNSFGGLSTGVQTLTIFDANTCSLVSTFSVGNTSLVQLSIVSQTNVQCYNQCDGKLILNVLNAVLPVTYSLTNLPTFTVNSINTVCAGTYTIKAIDNIGCYAVSTVTFTNPAPYSFSVNGTPLICVSKTATLNSTVAGGTAPYTYSWMPGGFTTPSISVSPPASTVYSLNVFDSKGCTLNSITHTVNVNPPLSVSVSAQNSGICPGTTAQITPSVTGGDGNYSYLWLPGNATTPSIFISNLTVPSYTCIVSDVCGSPTFTKVIDLQIFPVTVPTFSADIIQHCEPLCVQFKNTTPNSTNSYWNFGDKPFEQSGDNPYYCYLKNGSYNVKLTLTDLNGCKVSSTLSNYITVLAQPKPDFITRPGIITDNLSEAELVNSSSNATSYQWYIDDVYKGNTPNVSINFTDTVCFIIKLIANNNNGCSDSLFRKICVKPGFNFYMPNCFSPNLDGLNDILTPFGTAWLAENYTFKIVNRWGQLVFQTNNISEGWDGKLKGVPCPNDTYFWTVSVKDYYQKEYAYKGYIQLLR